MNNESLGTDFYNRMIGKEGTFHMKNEGPSDSSLLTHLLTTT